MTFRTEGEREARRDIDLTEIILELLYQQPDLLETYQSRIVYMVLRHLDEYEELIRQKILERFKQSEGHILIMGMPGAGKSTQGRHLAKILDMPYLATGDILREELRQKSQLGLTAKGYMDAGDLVPDSIMIEMIKERLSGSAMCVVDGFPRTLAQVESNPYFAQHAIVLDLSNQDATDRILARSEGRTDDTPETITTRLARFSQMTDPVIQRFRESNQLTEVPQSKDDPIWMVFSNLIRALAAY
jgi:adenylate kinase